MKKLLLAGFAALAFAAMPPAAAPVLAAVGDNPQYARAGDKPQ